MITFLIKNFRDAIITSSVNCLTSFVAGFVTFSILGFMSKKLNKDISTVVADGKQFLVMQHFLLITTFSLHLTPFLGPGLVFIVYPEAISTMYGSVFFSILFFVMLITLGLDSTVSFDRFFLLKPAEMISLCFIIVCTRT